MLQVVLIHVAPMDNGSRNRWILNKISQPLKVAFVDNPWDAIGFKRAIPVKLRDPILQVVNLQWTEEIHGMIVAINRGPSTETQKGTLILLDKSVPLQKHVSLPPVDNRLLHMLARSMDPTSRSLAAWSRPSINKNQIASEWSIEAWMIQCGASDHSKIFLYVINNY